MVIIFHRHLFTYKNCPSITRPNSSLDRSSILSLYLLGFQGQDFKHVKILSERSKILKEWKKKGSILVAESAYNSQNAVWPRNVEVKGKQDCSYQGEALNVPSVF